MKHTRSKSAGAATTATGLARQAQVPVHVVRYYTRIGLLRPARDPANGHKLFAEAHLKRLRFILQAKALGYTLREIGAIIREAERGKSPCPRVREIIEQRIADNRQRLEETLSLQRRMERALRAWAKMPDGVPDGKAVCRLIEAIAMED
jgi:DNA-binding transcriptional MerR regulator